MARLVFLGSPEAAVIPLRTLVEAGHDVRCVISQPDKRRGRGGALGPSPAKETALELGLTVADTLDVVGELDAELGVVVAYGRIIPQAVLDLVPMVNVHFSLLPRWRGAAPVERAILCGDSDTGVCIMCLEAGLDTGPVLASRRVRIDHRGREHAGALTMRLAVTGAEMLVDLLAGGASNLPAGEPQHGEPTYASKLAPSDFELQWSNAASDLERVVRLDRAWTTFRGERLAIVDAVADGQPGVTHGRDGDVEAGVMEGAVVRCGQGTLELLEVQPAGKRLMAAEAWMRGVHLHGGERLGEK